MKPVTDVSGARSSCATVESTRRLVALGPLAGLGVAQTEHDPLDGAAPSDRT